ncbi:Uncharacterised protein [Mycobacteroides abscessus subsp. abscessus]|nr:Uncharacterised protein [Mycobacteroides abscessus subsp. abscessus]
MVTTRLSSDAVTAKMLTRIDAAAALDSVVGTVAAPIDMVSLPGVGVIRMSFLAGGSVFPSLSRVPIE